MREFPGDKLKQKGFFHSVEKNKTSVIRRKVFEITQNTKIDKCSIGTLVTYVLLFLKHQYYQLLCSVQYIQYMKSGLATEGNAGKTINLVNGRQRCTFQE
jgi:hypothetical protein